ncbi:transcriptional regulator [Microbacterium faecale]|uniref:Transcriptional regulator n=1 Tax=Microbacterium faecale TaxID=1804630 RepID=A0A916Y3T5_9MICO|nr:TetR/AcrR family transcriptional regulator [Microbacterium faecale]GGD29677.1 transcriptional regulator [Microbacterium faecale]
MTSRGAYAKGIAKRDEILSVALDVVATHGYRRASVREIADAVGLSQAGLLHYFDSKDELFTAVLRKRDEVDAALIVDDPLAGLLRIVSHNAEVPGLVQLYAQLSVAAADPSHRAHEFFTERYKRLRTSLTAALSAAQLDGSLRSNFDPASTATSLIAATDGLQTQFLLDPSVDMAGELRTLLDDLRSPDA